jgi:hypothetical protein
LSALREEEERTSSLSALSEEEIDSEELKTLGVVPRKRHRRKPKEKEPEIRPFSQRSRWTREKEKEKEKELSTALPSGFSSPFTIQTRRMNNKVVRRKALSKEEAWKVMNELRQIKHPTNEQAMKLAQAMNTVFASFSDKPLSRSKPDPEPKERKTKQKPSYPPTEDEEDLWEERPRKRLPPPSWWEE